MKNKKIVILEQNHIYRDYLKRAISIEGGHPFCFEKVAICLENLTHLNPDLLVVGSLARETVIRLLTAISAIDCRLPIMIISNDPQINAFITINRLKNICTLASFKNDVSFANTMQRTVKAYKRAEKGLPLLVGRSLAVTKLKQKLPELGNSKENILIRGENATGKELLARAVHFSTSGPNGLFIKLNAAVPAGTSISSLMNDLINARKLKKTRGVRVKTNPRTEGTLYLEEISDLPERLQSELLLITDSRRLRFREEKGHEGAHMRLIAATSKDIGFLVKKRKFRKDLYYRLNVLSLHLPPLRKRMEDIAHLTDFFTYKYCKYYGKSYFELSKQVKTDMLTHAWPGNVGELEDLIRRTVKTGDETIVARHIKASHRGVRSSITDIWLAGMSTIHEPIDVKEYLKYVENGCLKDIGWQFMAHVEKKILKKALEYTNWNRKKAAVILNISYKSVLNKIKTYGLA